MSSNSAGPSLSPWGMHGRKDRAMGERSGSRSMPGLTRWRSCRLAVSSGAQGLAGEEVRDEGGEGAFKGGVLPFPAPKKKREKKRRKQRVPFPFAPLLSTTRAAVKPARALGYTRRARQDGRGAGSGAGSDRQRRRERMRQVREARERRATEDEGGGGVLQ